MYIFASTREWNRKAFEILQQNFSEEGVYVSNQQELEECLTYTKDLSWVFFAHWSSIIPNEICEKINGVIFHCTDLPYGRGGSPLQNLIINDHKSTKLSAIRLSEKLDAGNILLKTDVSLEGTAYEIFQRMSLIIANQCLSILTNNFQEIEQSGNIVVFKRRKPDESDILINDFNTLGKIYDFIRMLDCDGYPRAFFKKNNFRFEFSDAKIETHDSVICTVKITKEISRKDII